MHPVARFLVTTAAFTLVGPTLAQGTPIAGPVRQRGIWAQDYAGLTADPAVRFGRLPNGMRYAIFKHDTLKGAISLRMLINSGSLSERDEERGLAHFLEHMAFRGSTNVADGDTVRILERLGLRFGADTNAGTNFDRTIYQFDFPSADNTSLDTGLMLFREIGGRLKLDDATVNAERGVILSEERLRASGVLKAAEAQTALTLPGTRVAERFPIGTIETINAATAARIRRFYEANYRPENTTIVVVGSIDPAAVEAKLKQKFADWAGIGQADPHIASPPRAGSVTAKTFVSTDAVNQISLTWTRPVDTRADTDAKEEDEVDRVLGLTVLNLRLRERIQLPGAPFSVAVASARETFGVAEQTTIGVIPARGEWKESVAAVVAEQRQVARDGISAADIARVVSLVRPRMLAEVQAASTRTNPAIADRLVRSAADDAVFTSPAQDLVVFDRAVAHATPASISAAYGRAFAGNGPLAFRSTSDTAENNDGALATTVREAFSAPLAASAIAASVVWPYQRFGNTGRVVERVEAADTDTTTVRFANGTRLAVKHTPYIAGGVSVRVSFGDGIVGMHPAHPGSQWLLAFGAPAWLQGGTTRLTLSQMQRTLEGHNVSVKLEARDTDFIMSGETRKAELPFQLQLLAAYYSDAAYRSDAVDRVKGLVSSQISVINANASAVMSRVLGPLTHNGDTRWKSIPDNADIGAATAGDLAALLKDATATPADVVVVGDVTVDDAIAAVASTFGALPPAPHPRPPLYKGVVAPVRRGSSPNIATHGGRADQAVIVQLWPTTDYYSAPADSYALDVARALLSDRLMETVREKLGLTYSPFASSVSDVDLTGNGYFLAGIEVPPAKFDQFRQVLKTELEALASSDVSADALARAEAPIIAASTKSRETNNYWVIRTLRTLRDERAIPYFRDEITGIKAVTATDVRRVLHKYVVGNEPVMIQVTAVAKPAA